MNIDITEDYMFLLCSSDYPAEMEYLTKFLTREIDNAWIMEKTIPNISTERCFINSYGMVPVGLWLEVLKFCKSNNIYFELSERAMTYMNQFTLDYNEFVTWVNNLFDGAEYVNAKGVTVPFAPRDYQINAAYNLLKYKKCCGEISTSAGKTLISFIIFKWLIHQIGLKRLLYIVPNAELAVQSAEKYVLYESYLKTKAEAWECGILKSNLKVKEKKKVESCNILFGTYQSLNKKKVDFFKDFVACIEDECHHGAANSLLNILNKCHNVQWSIGVTGTFPKTDTLSNLMIQSSLGPVIYRLTSDELINKEKSATPIYVVFEIMKWANDEERMNLFYQRCQKATEEGQNDLTLGSRLLKQEQQFINESYARLKYIGDMAIKMAKNTLILFGDIKGGYGQRLAEYIKNNSDKDVFYVDGSTPPETREYYNQRCEADNNGKTVIVASIGTYKEGVDIANIWSIFLVNSAKSENTVRQICGRGLRMFPGKDKTVLYDFIDDLRPNRSIVTKDTETYYENYMWKHYLARHKIYDEQHFPSYTQKITFTT